MRRRIGTVLLVLGLAALAYGAAVYFWRDPITDVYARWKQHQLAGQLAELVQEYQASESFRVSTQPHTADASPPVTDTPLSPAETTQAGDESVMRDIATRYYGGLELGQPLGRIVIPELDLNSVVVNGTRWGADLSRGPGRYPETFLPGMGKVTAIAGHRTTFGAPFRHIDRLEAGDEITLRLAYGTFHYRVTGHEIVDDEDWSVIEPRGGDTLVLSACHPLYSASHRWIVFAKLAEVETPVGIDRPLQPQAAAAVG